MLEAPQKPSFRHDGPIGVAGAVGRGPCLRVVHEIPGIYSAPASFAERRVDAGLPSLPEVSAPAPAGFQECSVQ